MFYDNYVRLCNSVNKSPSAVAMEIGIAKPTVSRWKTGSKPNHATALKVADYFGVPVSELTGEKEKAPTQEGEREIDDRQMKAAFLGGLANGLSDEEIDEYWDDARDYIGFKIQQKKNRSN